MPMAGPVDGERIQLGPPPLGGSVDGSIWYLLVVPGDDEQLTPLQGFSRGIVEVSSFLRGLAWLPASVWELGFSWAQKIKFAQEGLLSFNVIPINVAHLPMLDVGQHSPFCIVLSSAATDDAVAAWAVSCAARPLHATTAATGADVNEGALDQQAVRSFVRERLGSLAASQEFAVAAEAMLQHMRPEPPRATLDFQSNSHNTCVPNELLLYRAGFEFSGDSRLNPGRGDGPVLDAIVREAEQILSLRTPHATTPSLILATTGRSRLMEKVLLEDIKTAPKHVATTLAAAVRHLRDQTGYFGEVDYDLLQLSAFQAIMQLRATELHTFTDALAVRAMSEMSGFVRLPPAADRVWQTLKMVADCYRGNSDKRAAKLAKLMKRLRAELLDCMPAQFRPLVDRAPTDMRIVSDLPLEWTPTESGESLIFRHTCSRIPSTPGNMLLQTALPKPRIHLAAEELAKILVIRSFRETDPIRKMAEAGLSILERDEGTKVSIVDVHNLEELVDAFNGFDGACVVFDGHGAKTEEASGIYVDGKLIDPWVLRGVARIPPIAIPLACDTQPMDTQHSSAALAFLAAGARTVVGSLLPIDARKSSSFLMRLVRAIHTFLPILSEEGISRVTWAELFSVIQQSQLIHETAIRLREPRWRLDHDALQKATALAATRVFVRDGTWYPHFVRSFASLMQLSPKEFKLWMRDELPLPDCELFVQLGDPESIIVHLGDIAGEREELRALATAKADDAGAP